MALDHLVQRGRLDLEQFGRPLLDTAGALESGLDQMALDGRGRYLAAIQRDVDAILDEKTWTLPAHDASLSNFYGRTVEVDLGAAMRGWSMATVAGWFGADLGATRLARLQSELRRRIADPYLSALRNGPTGGFWWVHTTNNWNAVCHAGVAGTALAAVADPDLGAAVGRAARLEDPMHLFLHLRQLQILAHLFGGGPADCQKPFGERHFLVRRLGGRIL